MPVLEASGKVSHSAARRIPACRASEGLAFLYNEDDAPWLFGEQPSGTTGLARRLDPNVPYIAMRWDYDVSSKAALASIELVALVTAPKTGRSFWPGRPIGAPHRYRSHR